MDTSITKASVFICLWRVSLAQFMPQMGQMSPMGQMPQMQMMPQGMQMPQMQMGGMPPMMSGAMPMPIPMAMPQPKLPVVVMPFHSKNADKKRKEKKINKKKERRRKKDKRRRQEESCSSDDDSDSSTDFDYRRNAQRSGRGKHRRDVLTPVISYVNKKGDVVYQKKIKNDKAKDWLDKMPRKHQALVTSDEREMSYKDKYKMKRGRGRDRDNGDY